MFGELMPCGGGVPIPLLKSKLLVGRKTFCDIALAFPNVSSRHCEMELKDDYWFVRDLDSTNGIRVDGQPCQAEWLLPDEEFAVASHRYTIHYTVPSDSPAPKQTKSEPMFKGSLAEMAGVAEAKQSSEQPKEGATFGLGELIPVGGGSPIPLTKWQMVVGRHGRCDLAIPHGTVSARHCELEFTDGYWRVRDLGSRNGTSVDGERIESKWLLPGSVLGVAKHRYRIEYTPLSDSPPPDSEKASMKRGLLDKAGLLRRKT